MPYNTDKKQATAIFMNIKRRKGTTAAKAFGKKHSGDLAAERDRVARSEYTPRSKRRGL